MKDPRSMVRTIVQTGTITALFLGSRAFVQGFSVPVPPGLFGMGVLFALMKAGIVKPEWVRDGAGWLLGSMALFFVPSAVGIMEHGSLMASAGLRLALAITVGTVSVMAVGGLVAEWTGRRGEAQNHGGTRMGTVVDDSGV